MKKLIVLTILVLTTLLAAPSDALADDTVCVGALPPGTYDNVVVPPGAFCFVVNALVNGNLKALENSVLAVVNSTVRGNIEGDKADIVQVRGTTVEGNIHIKEAGRGPISGVEAAVCDSILPNGNIIIEKTIGVVAVGPILTNPGSIAACRGNGNTLSKGNIIVQENIIVPGSRMEIRLNEVGGNLQVFKNTGDGDKFVQNNTVRENLQCKENDPPFIGGANAAQKAEGQCF